MKALLFLPATLLALAGCTQDPGLRPVPGVREARAGEVTACSYVTDIRGTPGVYGVLADQGLIYSHNQMLASARDAGANTIVFDPLVPGAPVYELHAKAYRC